MVCTVMAYSLTSTCTSSPSAQSVPVPVVTPRPAVCAASIVQRAPPMTAGVEEYSAHFVHRKTLRPFFKI